MQSNFDSIKDFSARWYFPPRFGHKSSYSLRYLTLQLCRTFKTISMGSPPFPPIRALLEVPLQIRSVTRATFLILISTMVTWIAVHLEYHFFQAWRMKTIDPLKRNWINCFFWKVWAFWVALVPGSVWVELGRVARHRLSRVRAGLKNLGPGMAIARLAYKLIRNRACTHHQSQLSEWYCVTAPVSPLVSMPISRLRFLLLFFLPFSSSLFSLSVSFYFLISNTRAPARLSPISVGRDTAQQN